jgi:aminoglycoside 6'-N-acetyltransferase I
VTGDVTIRRAVAADRGEWARLRDRLWPGSPADHDAETRAHFASGAAAPVVFLAEMDGVAVGFLELDYRKYAPGCTSSPIPYIEGWYVEPPFRKRGVGRALVRAAEAYARAEGYDEIASDAEIVNTGSIAAQRALGFEEIERVVCFYRRL